MTALYTTQLAAAGSLSGGGATYGPWPGFRIIVLDVEWQYPGGAPGDVMNLIDDVSGAGFAAFLSADGSPASPVVTCKVAITDGGTLSAEAPDGTSVIITGWKLSMP